MNTDRRSKSISPTHLTRPNQLTPVGLTIFRSIHAIDRDKPNTANSDITYSIVVSRPALVGQRRLSSASRRRAHALAEVAFGRATVTTTTTTTTAPAPD